MIKFEELLHNLHTVPNINRGGCAVAAYLMCKTLRNEGKIAHVAYFYTYGNYAYYLNERYFKKEIREPSSCSHALVLYKNKYWDSNGIYDDVSLFDHVHFMPLNIVLKTIQNPTLWNSSFDRDNIQILSKITKINLLYSPDVNKLSKNRL